MLKPPFWSHFRKPPCLERMIDVEKVSKAFHVLNEGKNVYVYIYIYIHMCVCVSRRHISLWSYGLKRWLNRCCNNSKRTNDRVLFSGWQLPFLMVHHNYLGWPILLDCNPLWLKLFTSFGSRAFDSQQSLFQQRCTRGVHPGDLGGSTMWSQFRSPPLLIPSINTCQLKAWVPVLIPRLLMIYSNQGLSIWKHNGPVV